MLSQRLKQLRADRKMSQRELAEHLFVSQQAVGKWERNEATPNPETIIRIAEIFGISTDDLLGRNIDEKETVPAQVSEDEFDKNRIMAAFLGGDQDLTSDEQEALWDDVYEYARFKAEQWKRKKDK